MNDSERRAVYSIKDRRAALLSDGVPDRVQELDLLHIGIPFLLGLVERMDGELRELKSKSLLYLGKSPEDAMMTFAEDGSTWSELVRLAGATEAARRETNDGE